MPVLKDPNEVFPVHFIWCNLADGANTNNAANTGELSGATISTSSMTASSTGITIDSDNTSAVTVQGVTYGANTVANAWLSGGTAGENYTITNRITTSDSRTLEKTLTVKVRDAV